jgi:hypothetical protein
MTMHGVHMNSGSQLTLGTLVRGMRGHHTVCGYKLRGKESVESPLPTLATGVIRYSLHI